MFEWNYLQFSIHPSVGPWMYLVIRYMKSDALMSPMLALGALSHEIIKDGRIETNTTINLSINEWTVCKQLAIMNIRHYINGVRPRPSDTYLFQLVNINNNNVLYFRMTYVAFLIISVAADLYRLIDWFHLIGTNCYCTFSQLYARQDDYINMSPASLWPYLFTHKNLT